jgi:hypothetical protein
MQLAQLRSERAPSFTAAVHSSLLLRSDRSFSACGRLSMVDGTQLRRTPHVVMELGEGPLMRLVPDEPLMKMLILDHDLHARIEATADPWSSLASDRKRRRRSWRQRPSLPYLRCDMTALPDLSRACRKVRPTPSSKAGRRWTRPFPSNYS